MKSIAKPDIARAIQMREAGASWAQIGKELGFSRSHTCRHVYAVRPDLRSVIYQLWTRPSGATETDI